MVRDTNGKHTQYLSMDSTFLISGSKELRREIATAFFSQCYRCFPFDFCRERRRGDSMVCLR